MSTLLNSLVHYYQHEAAGNLPRVDVVGGVNMTARSPVGTSQPGINNLGVGPTAPGIGGYDTPFPGSLTPTDNSPFAVSLWFLIPAPSIGFGVLLEDGWHGSGAPNDRASFQVRMVNPDLVLRCGQPNDGVTEFVDVVVAPAYTRDVWHNLVFTYENAPDQFRIWFDGTLFGTQAIAGGRAGRFNYLTSHFIENVAGGGAPDLAIVDEVGFWDRQFVQADVDELWAQTPESFFPFLPAPQPLRDINLNQWEYADAFTEEDSWKFERLSDAFSALSFIGFVNLIYALAKGTETIDLDWDVNTLRTTHEGAPNPGPADDEWVQCLNDAKKIMGFGDTSPARAARQVITFSSPELGIPQDIGEPVKVSAAHFVDMEGSLP